MLTIVCWKWVGYRNIYTGKHVARLRDALHRLSTPDSYKLVCVTDDPTDLPNGVTPIPLWEPPVADHTHGANCFGRLRLFDSEFCASTFGARVLSVDLDSVITDDITTLIPPRGTPFKILAGRAARYNGSLFYVEPHAANDHIWSKFIADPMGAVRRIQDAGIIGSDQGWLDLIVPSAPTWDANDGVLQLRQYLDTGWWTPPMGVKAVFCAGDIKPWDAEFQRLAPRLYEMHARPGAFGDPNVWTGDQLGALVELSDGRVGRIVRVQGEHMQVRVGLRSYESYWRFNGRAINGDTRVRLGAPA